MRAMNAALQSPIHGASDPAYCENDDLLLRHGGVGCLLRYQFETAESRVEPAVVP